VIHISYTHARPTINRRRRVCPLLRIRTKRRRVRRRTVKRGIRGARVQLPLLNGGDGDSNAVTARGGGNNCDRFTTTVRRRHAARAL
jgi:hypothetical protein